MARVCLGAEKIPSINVSKHRLDVEFDNTEEAIAMSAMYAANHLKGVTAIISMTESGRTALMTVAYQFRLADLCHVPSRTYAEPDRDLPWCDAGVL